MILCLKGVRCERKVSQSILFFTIEFWLFWKYKILTEINLRQGTVFYKVGGVRKNGDIRNKEQSDYT